MPDLVLVYFAWVREAIGLDEERVKLPPSGTTVADLVQMLAERGGGYRDAFADPSRLRAAIDRQFAPLDTPIDNATEVALFPPVTGG